MWRKNGLMLFPCLVERSCRNNRSTTLIQRLAKTVAHLLKPTGHSLHSSLLIMIHQEWLPFAVSSLFFCAFCVSPHTHPQKKQKRVVFLKKKSIQWVINAIWWSVIKRIWWIRERGWKGHLDFLFQSWTVTIVTFQFNPTHQWDWHLSTNIYQVALF